MAATRGSVSSLPSEEEESSSPAPMEASSPTDSLESGASLAASATPPDDAPPQDTIEVDPHVLEASHVTREEYEVRPAPHDGLLVCAGGRVACDRLP